MDQSVNQSFFIEFKGTVNRMDHKMLTSARLSCERPYILCFSDQDVC